MAEIGARRIWIGLVALLLAGAWAAAVAQTAGVQTFKDSTGSIVGRLTDLTSKPLAFATVIARNEATGAEARTTSAKNGSYRLTGLAAGEYTIEAESSELGHGRLEGIHVSGGYEVRVQAAMAFEAAAPVPAKIDARDSASLKRIQTEVHEIAMVRPEVNATLAAYALGQLTLPGSRLAETAREKPSTIAMVIDVSVAERTLGSLQVSGTKSAAIGRPMPATQSLVLTSMLASEPLRTMNLSGHPELGRGSAGAPIAMQAAAGIVQPLTRLSQINQRVDPVTPVVQTTLTATELEALPVTGRRWQDFVLDTPMAATESAGRSQTSLRGAGQEPAETSIDGVSTRLAFGGSGGSGPESSGPGSNGPGGRDQNGMAQVWAGSRGSQVAEAAIHEVETVAGNAEAEGMRTAGGRVNVETARGTNGLHGQGFLFDRQNTWGAQNPFSQWVKETVPAMLTYNPSGPPLSVPVFDNGPSGKPESFTPADHETVWGIGLGSQLRRDKLFWFGALDSYNRNDPGLSTVKHPYLCANPPLCSVQTGFFGQPTDDQLQVLAARLGLSDINPVVEGLTAYSCMLETLGGALGGSSSECLSGSSLNPLFGPAMRTAKQWTGFGRLDWQAAERHRFTLEGIGGTWNSPGGGLTRVSETYGNHSFGSSQASEEWLLGRWEAFLTPNLLVVTQGSSGRNILQARPGAPSAFEQTLLGPNAWGQLPQIVVDNRYGFTIGNPSRFGQGSYPDEHAYQAQETVNWVRGNLMVKSGFELSHNADAISLLRNQTGTYTYSSVENFASDTLVFAEYGLQNPNNFNVQHGCDETGTVWRDSGGALRGLANLPCYSYYSQTLGPTNWDLSTNDWAGFATVQWQPKKLLVLAGGLRWEREQLPPPIASVWPPPPAPNSPSGTLSPKGLPSLGNNWGPRISLAMGSVESHWPVLRLGYGMYFGRTENATVETALTQTGSLKGDLNFFMRPTDDCQFCAGGAPAFPYVLSGDAASIVKPGAVEFAPNFRNPEVHQAVAAVEEELPGHVQVTASALVSLGRRLPISIDTNIDHAVNPQTITYAVVDGTGLGPIKAPTITVPFYANWPFTDCSGSSPLNQNGQCGRINPNYQQISGVMSRANSTYEAAMLKVDRFGRRGLSMHAHYTYAHAMDWNPNESTIVAGSDVLDPEDYSREYGTSNLDIRHSAAAMVVEEAPWKLTGLAGQLANGWMVSGIGQFHSGLPYTMRTSGSLAEEFDQTTGRAIIGLGPGMNGSGGDNRVYGMGSDGHFYNIGRNTYRYPATWKADMRVGKKFDLGRMRQLEVLVESFNLFNHQNVTELETTGYYLEAGTASGSLPTLNFLKGLKANTTAFGQPLNVNATNFYRERQIQVGARMRF
jgi:hypothetical protein